MTDNSLPCPFCGGAQLQLVNGAFHPLRQGIHAVVVCKTCGAQGPRTIVGWDQRAEDLRIQDMAMLLKRAVSALYAASFYPPTIATKISDYLRQHNLLDSPLREEQS